MPRFSDIDRINRIIDANFNRTKEGLRVCEEISRFILESRALTAQLKAIRHKIDILSGFLASRKKLLKGRDSSRDIGFKIYGRELERKNYADIFFANIQRVKESVRVLEEFSKIRDIKAALGFKKVRYSVYQLEKKAVKRIK